jgi:cyclopropane fatty-acyl-phospholipid synthase-like methyltransferase
MSKRHAPATQRNQDAILQVLQAVLPPTGTVLEVASGTGEHSIYFAPRLAPREWLPSDKSPEALASIQAWQQTDGAPNLRAPLHIDVSKGDWAQHVTAPGDAIAAIVAINMVHIAPWTCAVGLFSGARSLLPVGGIVYLYGPFTQNGRHSAPSNAAFDASLRSQNPAWGLRDVNDLEQLAKIQSFTLLRQIEMPANNLSLVFVRAPELA